MYESSRSWLENRKPPPLLLNLPPGIDFIAPHYYNWRRKTTLIEVVVQLNIAVASTARRHSKFIVGTLA